MVQGACPRQRATNGAGILPEPSAIAAADAFAIPASYRNPHDCVAQPRGLVVQGSMHTAVRKGGGVAVTIWIQTG